MGKSPHSLDGAIIKIRKGLAIYKTHASPYWNARILDSKAQRYIVRSTKETSRIAARDAAEELAADIKTKTPTAAHEYSFKYYATDSLRGEERWWHQVNATPITYAPLNFFWITMTGV